MKPLIADFCSSLLHLKLYNLGPVETKLLIPLPEISSVISPSISPVSVRLLHYERHREGLFR